MNRPARALVAFAALAAVVAVPDPSPAAPRLWTRTADLGAPRGNHTLTVLDGPNCGTNCGKVLATGGVGAGGEELAGAELYDPVARTWAPTGSMARGRNGHTATRLAGGKVLVAGGNVPGGSGQPTPSAEIYDPVTGSWTPTGSMDLGRYGHAAVLLAGPGCGSNCGKVLVVGGGTDSFDPVTGLANTPVTELYDPTSGTWARTGSLSIPRMYAIAVLVTGPGCSPRCGKVLLAGPINDRGVTGVPTPDNEKRAELYDPVVGLWSPAGARVATGYPGAGVQLATGKVLVVDRHGEGSLPRGADLFDPVTGAWTPATAPPIGEIEQLVRLPGGPVMGLAGASAVLYHPDADRWSTTDSLNEARSGYGGISVLLPCGASGGRVLVAGGGLSVPGGTVWTATSELYDRVPTVQGMTPSTGALAGGTTVTLRGLGLAGDGPVQVRFGGRDATVVDVDPAGGQIVVVSPPGAAHGPVPVTVSVDGVGAEACGPAQFSYAPDPAGLVVRELSVAAARVIEGDAGSAPATFRVSLNGPLDHPFTVRYATRDTTATAGEDYEPARGTVDVPAGQTTADVAVAVLGDTTVEPDETFVLAVASTDAGLRVAAPEAVGTIVDDDRPGAPKSLPAVETATDGPQPAATAPGGPAALPGNLPQSVPGSPAHPGPAPGASPGPGLSGQSNAGGATQTGSAVQPVAAGQPSAVAQAAPAAQVQTQSVAQAQPGLMVERQRQAEVQRADNTYLASSRRTDPKPSPVVPVLAGLVAAAGLLARSGAATAGAMRRRDRP